MTFTKGHTLSQGPRKPGGGKKKSVKTILKEALETDYQYLPAYFEAIRNRALRTLDVICPECKHAFVVLGGGDTDALKEQLSRHLGRPHQSQDLRVTAKREYSPEELQLMSVPLLNETKLLEEWSQDAIQEQGTGSDLAQVVNEEKKSHTEAKQ